MTKRGIALLFACLFAFMALGLAGCTKAEEKVLKVGFDPSFPPMGFTQDGKNVGFDLDLAQEVAKKIGYTYKEVPIKWAQKENEMNTGNINVIWNGFTVDESRKATYELTKAYMENKQVVMVKKDSAYQTLADLKGKKIGIQEDSTALGAMDANPDFKNSVTMVQVNDNELARLDLDTGAVDGVALDSVVADWMISKHEGKYRLLDQILITEVFAVGFKKGDTELRDKVQKALDEMMSDGTFKTISEKWFGKDVAIKE